MIMVYVHINDLLKVIEFLSKERVENSKNGTLNSITNNGRISYAGVRIASKRRTLKKEIEKNILRQKMQK